MTLTARDTVRREAGFPYRRLANFSVALAHDEPNMPEPSMSVVGDSVQIAL